MGVRENRLICGLIHWIVENLKQGPSKQGVDPSPAQGESFKLSVFKFTGLEPARRRVQEAWTRTGVTGPLLYALVSDPGEAQSAPRNGLGAVKSRQVRFKGPESQAGPVSPIGFSARRSAKGRSMPSSRNEQWR